MVAPEGVSPLTRYAALVAEVPVIRLAEPDAVNLGLREGQIVQGAVQARGDSLLFQLNGRFFDLPPALQRVAPGDLRWFRVTRQGDVFVLRMVPRVDAELGASSAPQSVGSEIASSSPRTAPTAVTATEPLLSARHVGLLGRGPGTETLSGLLSPGRLESQLIDAGAVDLARALALSRLRSDSLSASVLQAALGRSGLWVEAALAAGRPVAQFDLKVILRQIGRLFASRAGGDADDLGSAIDEIERKQLDAIQQAADGRQVFSVTVPFADSPPVEFRFERGSGKNERGEGGYSIDIHVAPPQTGDIWLKTVVVGKRVDVSVWTKRSDVARIAQSEEPQLGETLREAGLALNSFRVSDGEPPGLGISNSASARGSLGLDLKA
jgi:hypothetical protein